MVYESMDSRPSKVLIAVDAGRNLRHLLLLQPLRRQWGEWQRQELAEVQVAQHLINSTSP